MENIVVYLTENIKYLKIFQRKSSSFYVCQWNQFPRRHSFNFYISLQEVDGKTNTNFTHHLLKKQSDVVFK